jgi:hypothetical protein
MMALRGGILPLIVLSAVACARATVAPPAKAPSPSPASTAAPSPPPGVSTAPSGDAGPSMLTAPPPDCDGFAENSIPIQTAVACPRDETGRLAALDDALAENDVLHRDQKLRSIEGCAGFEPGLLRALRADLAPVECADTIVDPLLGSSKDTLQLEVSQVLRGLSLGAKLLRTSDQPPLLLPPFTRERFEHFLNSSIRPWYLAQSKVVFDMASLGAKLSGYGKAIVAIEAGLSDLRFVENVRKVPLPTEMTADREIVEVYQQALEDALEPRKLRARDAILIGTLHLGQLGVLSDPRLQRASAKLVRLFSGSRIDALDALLMPGLVPLSQATPVERLAAKLPSFYADRLLRLEDVGNAPVVRALLERGLPPRLRQQLEKISHSSAEVACLFARGQLELGRRYFRPADFTRAAILLEQKIVLADPTAMDSRLVAALAHALEGGPDNAVQLMLTGPMLPKGMGNVETLDRLSRGTGVLSGMSAFNAGHLLSIIPQEHPNPEHWLRIARYFADAERKLDDPSQKALAHARAEDARATAQQVREAMEATR